MRGFLVCSLTFGLLAGAAPGALADDLKDCRYGVADIRVASCTRRIDLPDLKPELKSSAYNNRGWGYNEKGDFEKAMPDFNEALRLNPKNAAAYGNRGYAHLRQSDFGLARSDLDKSIELKPDNAWAFTIRGRVHAALGKYERALADHTESIRLEPNSLNAYGNRANTHYAKRDYANALTDYRKVLTLTADNPRDRAHQETAKERISRLEKSQAVAAAQARTRGVGAAPAAATALPTPTSQRVALVIGNSAYASVSKLANPANDAKAIADMFRRTGFTDVTEVYDLGFAAMSEALKTFGDKAAGADWAVVFFAGHGIEMNGSSYLIPVDAKLQRDTHVAEEAIPLERVQAKVDGATKLGLVILDACRNNPFAAKMVSATGAKRSIGGGSRGLAPVEPEGNVLVAYSAKHGTVAEDGTGRNSPFTESLIARAEEPNLDVGILFRKVRDDVRAKTQKRQDPFVYGSLGGDLLFFKTAGR